MSDQKRARASRADDERILRWLSRALSGDNSSIIAGADGTTAATVRMAIKRVRDADISESGEPERVVIRGYA